LEIAGEAASDSPRSFCDRMWSGDVKIVLSPAKPVEFTLEIRIPDRTESDLYTATPDLSDQDEEIDVPRLQNEVHDYAVVVKWLEGRSP
jgi:hypothetical protein